MVPWLTTLAAPVVSVKRRWPARKSEFDKFSVEATSPATSTVEPAPNSTPFGLIRKTRPFDCSVPNMTDGSAPTTRLSTELAADCWMKRVISFVPIENPRQLIIALGEFVIDSRLPCWLILALPETTDAPVGLASAKSVAKHDATAATITRGLSARRRAGLAAIAISP